MSSDIRPGLVQSIAKAKRVPGDRARSVPHRQQYTRTVAICVVHYLSILGAVTTLTIFFIQPTPLATKLFVLFLGLTAVTWLAGFFKRRHTHCPLCKGTPLINSGALAHQKAYRLFPFNHGVTAVLSIIATQKFRCMYCGTSFDMLKTPSHLLSGGDPKYRDYYTTYTSDDKS